MTMATLRAQLDAHDALVRACLDGTLSLLEFAASYGDFPVQVGAAAGRDPASSQALRSRIAFHTEVAALLAGVPDFEGWLAGAVIMRLGHLASRHPDFGCAG